MARRGSNSFRRTDALRALRVAVDGGLDPHGLELVVAKDGTVTFRILDARAAALLPLAPQTPAEAREWQTAIEELKAKTPKTKGR